MAAEDGSSPASPPSVPEIGTRKLGPRVSPRQMEILVDFLTLNPFLANTSKKSKEVEPWVRERLWEEVAGKLNAKGPAVKSRSSWRKFWSSRSTQIKRTVARVAKMSRIEAAADAGGAALNHPWRYDTQQCYHTACREESRQPPRPPPPPPPPRPPTEQILLLVKQEGTPTVNAPGRFLLPRPGPTPQHQVLLHVGAPGEPATMFMAAADCPPQPAIRKEVTTPRAVPLQAQSLLNGMLVEQPAPPQQQPEPPKAAPLPAPPPLQPQPQQQQQQHVLVNGGPPPDPDSIPVLEPITAEEHFHSEMLHQTIRQTALLQDLLNAQQRIAQAAERQAQAAEDQSHALSQLVLFLVENHHSNRNTANASGSGDESCSEAALPLSITPEIFQGERSLT